MARIKMTVQRQEVKTLSQCFEDFNKHCKRKNFSAATNICSSRITLFGILYT